MSQLGGGIGTRGPGETQLETDRRKINRRIRHVEEQLENVRRIRRQQRQRRESVPVATVALVGYTNAGKTHTVQRADASRRCWSPRRMFATLDPTIRAVDAAVEAQGAAVRYRGIHPQPAAHAGVGISRDIGRGAAGVADAARIRRDQPEPGGAGCASGNVLKELEAQDKPRLQVLNKIDLVSGRGASGSDEYRRHHLCFGKEGHRAGCAARADRRELTEDASSRVHLSVPQSEGKALSMLEARSRSCRGEYRDGSVKMEVQAPESVVRRVKNAFA